MVTAAALTFFPGDRRNQVRVKQFEAIAAPMMARLGYAGTPEYLVSY